MNDCPQSFQEHDSEMVQDDISTENTTESSANAHYVNEHL